MLIIQRWQCFIAHYMLFSLHRTSHPSHDDCNNNIVIIITVCSFNGDTICGIHYYVLLYVSIYFKNIHSYYILYYTYIHTICYNIKYLLVIRVIHRSAMYTFIIIYTSHLTLFFFFVIFPKQASVKS